MRPFNIPGIAAGIIIGIGALTTPAQAALNHTWVASNGADSNSCDRSAPCATYSGALAKTIAGGEISCADFGNFAGVVSINFSVTINCEAPSGSSLIGISLPSPTDVVVL